MAAASPGMVGRDMALATCRASIAAAFDGRPRSILVTGEAGIGKTRLVEAVAAALEADGWLVARDGRVLTRARIDDWRERVPVVRIESGDVAAGDRVGSEPALRVLRDVPIDFPGAFRSVEVSRNAGVVGMLHDGVEVRLGQAADLREKLLVVQTLLEMHQARRDEIGYIDASVAARPAVAFDLVD